MHGFADVLSCDGRDKEAPRGFFHQGAGIDEGFTLMIWPLSQRAHLILSEVQEDTHVCMWTQVFKNQSHKVVCQITWDMVPTQARYFSLSEMAVSLTRIPLRNSPKQCLPFGENKYHLQYFWMKP